MIWVQKSDLLESIKHKVYMQHVNQIRFCTTKYHILGCRGQICIFGIDLVGHWHILSCSVIACALSLLVCFVLPLTPPFPKRLELYELLGPCKQYQLLLASSKFQIRSNIKGLLHLPLLSQTGRRPSHYNVSPIYFCIFSPPIITS